MTTPQAGELPAPAICIEVNELVTWCVPMKGWSAEQMHAFRAEGIAAALAREPEARDAALVEVRDATGQVVERVSKREFAERYDTAPLHASAPVLPNLWWCRYGCTPTTARAALASRDVSPREPQQPTVHSVASSSPPAAALGHAGAQATADEVVPDDEDDDYRMPILLPDGRVVMMRKRDLRDDDQIVIDPPGAFASSRRAQRALDEEIAAAGGLEAWQATAKAESSLLDVEGLSDLIFNPMLDAGIELHKRVAAIIAERNALRSSPVAAPEQPEQQVGMLSDAARDVLAERKRQVEVEGWTPEHDDEHATGAMAAAAACYALSAAATVSESEYWRAKRDDAVKELWPWDHEWWKPNGQRRILEKAGALILAEIERLDRRAASLEPGKAQDSGAHPVESAGTPPAPSPA